MRVCGVAKYLHVALPTSIVLFDTTPTSLSDARGSKSRCRGDFNVLKASWMGLKRVGTSGYFAEALNKVVQQRAWTQHVVAPTRYRVGRLPSFLDSVIANENTSSISYLVIFNLVKRNYGRPLTNRLLTEENLRQLLHKTSPFWLLGLDAVHLRILKETAFTLAKQFYLVFRQSLDKVNLPSAWKEAIATTAYKTCDRLSFGSYRPIGLTIVPCNAMERVTTPTTT
ncbi:hypothetical protein CLF_113122 [Clonorchis sinensis]|uniref:Uncharacterized protein n=1 Tax=Clonorchis sinensis TaxID=79923 RepID=G7YXP1_CLOSI|nr:hypothetical protein CLF_113122 [Clonorchis sinensis]